MAKSVKVEIYDQTYHIGGDLEEAYVAELAAYVDRRMRDISEVTRTADTLKLAILAALNIADECFQLRRGAEGKALDWAGKAGEMVEILDRYLKEAEE